ncbi:MAG: hypothetical protein U0401_33960 [Anaerolineae bacterium]
MRHSLASLIKFFLTVLLFGPVVALAFLPGVGLFALAIFVVVLFLAILAVAVGYFSVKGIGHVTKSLNVSPLPRSVARPVAESRHYGRLITRVAQQYPAGPMRDRLDLTLKPVQQWLDNLTRLEQGLAKLYLQRNLDRELRQTVFEIDELRRRSLMALDDQETHSLRALMDSKKQHLAALRELQAFRTQAELKIRKISSDLATTHAEMLLIVAKGDFNDNRFRRLDENLQEHLSSMRDMLAAMDEMGYRRAAS